MAKNHIREEQKSKSPIPSRMVYVAVPYWDNSETVRDYRRQKAIDYAFKMIKQGTLVYSPLAYTERWKADSTKEGYWIAHGLRMIDVCDEVHVLTLDGWESSGGVKGEIARAESQGKNIIYIKEFRNIAFCGSRTIDYNQCHKIIEQEIIENQGEMIITHGEPHGVCESVKKVCLKTGHALKVHHLKKQHMQGAFEKRSMAVFRDCDYAVFIHDGISQGTMNELELCLKWKIPHSYYVLRNGKLEKESTERFEKDREKKEKAVTVADELTYSLGRLLES